MRKRIFAMLVALIMAISLFPVTALAVNEPGGTNPNTISVTIYTGTPVSEGKKDYYTNIKDNTHELTVGKLYSTNNDLLFESDYDKDNGKWEKDTEGINSLVVFRAGTYKNTVLEKLGQGAKIDGDKAFKDGKLTQDTIFYKEDTNKEWEYIQSNDNTWKDSKHALFGDVTFTPDGKIENKPPEKPTENDVGMLLASGAVKVECTNTNVSHEAKTYGLLTGSYTIGAVEGDATNGYTCTITVTPDAYVALYNEEISANHTLTPESQTGTITLHYAPVNADGTVSTWQVKSVVPVTFTVVCGTPEPQPPEKPTENDVGMLLASGAVKVECTNTNVSHEAKTYGLLTGSYTIGDVTSDTTGGGFTCTVTIYAEKYIEQYNTDTKVTHTLQDGETNPKTITLRCVVEGDALQWIKPTESVAFNVVCQTPEEEPEKHPVVVYAVFNDDKDNKTELFRGQAEHGTELIPYLNTNVKNLDRSGYIHDEWYKLDWYGHKFANNAKVNGWTNVYVKYTSVYPVYANVYRNGDTSKPVASELLGYYPHGTGMADILVEKELRDSLDRLYSSTYGYDWAGIWSHEISNYPAPVGDGKVNGWTNLCTMVYDKYPVYANVYHNGDTSEPVASELLGYYPHGTGMADILEDKGLTDSLDSLYTSTYGYDWDKIWSHEISNYPTPVGNRTVSGWTNLCTMVYDKVPVVYFRTLEDLNLYQNPATRDASQILKSTTASVGSTLPTADAPAAVREGYTFQYWSREGQAADVTGQTVNGWTNLYAIWKANTYTIVYHGNGGTLDNGKDQSTTNCKYDTEATIKNNPFTRENWTFLGWAAKADGYKDDIIYTGGEKVKNLTAEPNGKVHLYAIWTPNQKPLDPIVAAYKVEHYVEQLDGSYTLADTDFPLYGKIDAIVTAEAKSYEHYSVNEEMSAATKSGEVIMPSMGNDGQPVILTLKLYYKLDRFTVIYTDGVANRNVFDDQSYNDVPYGAETPAFDGTPTRPGYRFVGWAPTVTETVTDSVTYTAQWRRSYHHTTSTEAKPTLNKADHYAYVVGYPDGTVQPQGAITRAEVATIFFRLLSDETRDLYWTKSNGYTDVKAGDWFNNAVSTLSNAGIINGYPDGTFRPNAPITRAEMAKVIAMFAELDKDSEGFKDIAGHWAEAYIKLAAGNGWIAGYPDGTFRPDQYITRAETMTMINRVLERVPSEEEHLLSHRVMLTFPDNQPGDWYYIAVQEATNSHTYERYATEKNGDEQWIKLIDNYDWTKLEF